VSSSTGLTMCWVLSIGFQKHHPGCGRRCFGIEPPGRCELLRMSHSKDFPRLWDIVLLDFSFSCSKSKTRVKMIFWTIALYVSNKIRATRQNQFVFSPQRFSNKSEGQPAHFARALRCLEKIPFSVSNSAATSNGTSLARVAKANSQSTS
jgi:hypothetical protein